MCQCTEEDALLKSTGTNPKNRLSGDASRSVKGAKLKIDLLSPTFTETTTPASTFFTPRDGPLSLSSVISMANAAFETSSAPSGPNRAKKFHFNSPSRVEFAPEEQSEICDHNNERLQDVHAENAHAEILATTKQLPLDPGAIILNPPLLAPPPEEAEALIQATKGAVNDRMIREFKKLRKQATLENQKEQRSKREAKVDDRKEDIEAYKCRWEEFQVIQKLCDDVLERPEAAETHCSSFCIDFRDDLKFHEDENNKSSQSELSLLSAASMEAQRTLFAEKRQARVARYTSQKALQEMNGKSGRRQISYFRAIEETGIPSSDPLTPQLSPPRLAVTTDGTKITLGGTTEANGPTKTMTDIEVVISPDERKDDTSAITDVDFDRDYWLHRRCRIKPSRNKDDDSLGSSLVSYGCLPVSINSPGETEGGKQKQGSHSPAAVQVPVRGQRKVRTKTLSTGTTGMTAKNPNSLGDRIADLEKKFGIVPPGKTTDKGNQGAPNAFDGLADLQSPTVNPAATFPSSDDLEPTKLEAIFDGSSSSDIRERIVLKNSARSANSIAFMNTESFLRLCDDHAMIKVSRGFDDSYVIHENKENGRFHSPNGSIQENNMDTSFAADVADEVGVVLQKYRDDGMMADTCASDAAFADAQGKLFCA